MKRKETASASSSNPKRQRGTEESTAPVVNTEAVESPSSITPLSAAFVKNLLSIKVKERHPNRIPAILRNLIAMYDVANDVGTDGAIIDGHGEYDIITAIRWSITMLTAAVKNMKDDMIAAGFSAAQVKTRAIAILSFLTSTWYYFWQSYSQGILD